MVGGEYDLQAMKYDALHCKNEIFSQTMEPELSKNY